MNNHYRRNQPLPGFPTPLGTPDQQTVPGMEQAITGFPFVEVSYIENILRFNKGKQARFYMSFPDSIEWRDKVFTGVIEEAGRDHIIISDPNTGKWHLLLIIYLNYVEFDEQIDYELVFPTPPIPPVRQPRK